MGFSRQEYWSGLPCLLQGIFLTQELNLCLLHLLHCRCILYHLSHQGSHSDLIGSVQFSSFSQSCPTLGDPMDCSTPGLLVHHQLLEFTQTHVHFGEGNGSPLQYSCWRIPWTEEPCGLQSMASLGVGLDSATSLSLFTLMHWRRKWQPAPVFLPGESRGRGSLVGCRLWGRTESDTTEVT